MSSAFRPWDTWRDPRYIPRIRMPTANQWQSDNGQESQTVIAWAGHPFRQQWAGVIHREIGQWLHVDEGLWRYQEPFYCRAFQRFFRGNTSAFNAVTVIPHRLPFSFRPKTNDVARAQHTVRYQVRKAGRNDLGFPLRLASINMILGAGDIYWLPRRDVDSSELGYADILVERQFDVYTIDERRFCQTHEYIDRHLLVSGSIPALHVASLYNGLSQLVSAPIISFWKLHPNQWIDVLAFEIATGMPNGKEHGALIDVRWSHQPLAYHLQADPNNLPALERAISIGSRL